MEALNNADQILSVLAYFAPFLGILGIAVGFLKKAVFYVKVAKQAVLTFEELKEANKSIYEKIQNDPERKELAKVLSGGVKKIEGLTGLDIDGDGKT
jgi:hypothetical protein